MCADLTLVSHFGSMTESDVWAQLVSTTDIEMEHVQLTKNMITIGRNRGIATVLHFWVFLQNWDLDHVGNKLIELYMNLRKLSTISLLFFL